MSGGAELGSRRWPAVKNHHSTVLVPFGSTEQHGPHLPLDTDSRIAVAAARAVAKELNADGSRYLIAPAVTYGSSGEHQDFPGTVSIGTDALSALTVELVRSLSTWARRVIVVNGHGGNVDALVQAIPQLRAERHDVAWVSCGPPGTDAHAGFGETSLMLHLAPELVQLAAATVGATAPLGQLLPRLRTEGVRAVSPSGVLGDPTGASALEGERLFRLMVSDLMSRIVAGTADERGLLRGGGGGRTP